MNSKIKKSSAENKANKLYIVTRDGHRVSEHEYNTKQDANHEFNFWKKVVTKWPDGSKLKIEER
jgi:hypothetical protein